MEKVKIFTGASGEKGFQKLEGEINEWLSRKDGKIQIVCRYVTGAAGTTVTGWEFVNCTVTFFYKEMN